jgi:hypothetical protein
MSKLTFEGEEEHHGDCGGSSKASQSKNTVIGSAVDDFDE